MLAGSVIGVPGPVATTRPPWTCRLSTAVGGRYRPTLVRSSPSSGAMSTRSPTTIRRFGASSGMGISIQQREFGEVGEVREVWGGCSALGVTSPALPNLPNLRKPPCDVDHVHRLTGLGASLLMRA